MQDALESAAALQAAFDAECGKLHDDAKRWPSGTATALLFARQYAHHVRRFLSVATDAGHPAFAEAKKAFGHIEQQPLSVVFNGDADLRLAFDALKNLLAERHARQ
jgi:hypothetical protein